MTQFFHSQSAAAAVVLLLAIGQLAEGANNLIEGKYKLDHSNNFDSYLDALGVNFLLRPLAGLATPTVTIARTCPEGDSAPVSSPACTWNMTTETLFKSHTVTFQLGKEVADKTLDERDIVSTFTVVGDNTLDETQVGSTVITTLSRQFTPQTMVILLKAKDVTADATYNRL